MRGRRHVACLFAAAALAAPAAAGAFETAWSGFGTLGYAVSDQPFGYQRFIDEGGTLKRDSVIGLQLDAKLGERVGATVQAKAAADPRNDHGVRTGIAWAFLSYRPSNAWLLRAGKFRLPLYLHSENLDVGTTFDFARLPAEVYSQVLNDDFTGLAVARTWDSAAGEVSLDAYAGRAHTAIRIWFRDGVAPIQPPGAIYPSITVKVRGLALSLRRGDDLLLRAAYTHADVESRSPLLFAQRYPFVAIPGLPGVGYYQTIEGVYFGTTPVMPSIRVPLFTVAAEAAGPGGVRLVGEYARRRVRDTELGYDSRGAYVAALRRSGAFTPYLSYAVLRSTGRNLRSHAALNSHRVPDFVPFSALLNALQRAGADGTPSYDQRSIALGSSYTLSPTAKLKAELQRVHVGAVSALIDGPPGSDIRHQGFSVLTLTYSRVF